MRQPYINVYEINLYCKVQIKWIMKFTSVRLHKNSAAKRGHHLLITSYLPLTLTQHDLPNHSKRLIFTICCKKDKDVKEITCMERRPQYDDSESS